MRVMLSAAACTATLSAVTPAVAQPTEPTVGSSVADLVGSVADRQSEVDRLELEVGALRESVNQALVDLHDAQAGAQDHGGIRPGNGEKIVGGELFLQAAHSSRGMASSMSMTGISSRMG